MQQVAALQVLVAEELLLACVHKAGAIDAAIRTITRGHRLLRDAVLTVYIARRATELIALLSNKVRGIQSLNALSSAQKTDCGGFSLVFCKIMG